MGDDAWGLLRQILRGENYLGFQGNLMTYMLTKPDLAYIPLFLSHTAPPNYCIIV
jgi:hypothetical protein